MVILVPQYLNSGLILNSISFGRTKGLYSPHPEFYQYLNILKKRIISTVPRGKKPKSPNIFN